MSSCFLDRWVLVVFFLAGALTVFLVCESKPRSFLPQWLAAPLEVAGAVRTLTYHRGLVMQIEDWVGMPILMFGATLPAFLAAGLLGRASLSNLRCSKPLMMPSRAYDHSRKLEVTPTLDSFRFQQFLDPALLMSPVPMHSRRLQLE